MRRMRQSRFLLLLLLGLQLPLIPYSLLLKMEGVRQRGREAREGSARSLHGVAWGLSQARTWRRSLFTGC
jgi:hypothetical protein